MPTPHRTAQDETIDIDATTVEASFDMTSNHEPTEEQKEILRQSIATQLGVDVSEIENLDLVAVENSKKGGKRRLRRLLERGVRQLSKNSHKGDHDNHEQRWTVSFDTTKATVTAADLGGEAVDDEASAEEEAKALSGSVADALADEDFDNQLDSDLGVPVAVEQASINTAHSRHKTKVTKAEAAALATKQAAASTVAAAAADQKAIEEAERSAAEAELAEVELAAAAVERAQAEADEAAAAAATQVRRVFCSSIFNACVRVCRRLVPRRLRRRSRLIPHSTQPHCRPPQRQRRRPHPPRSRRRSTPRRPPLTKLPRSKQRRKPQVRRRPRRRPRLGRRPRPMWHWRSRRRRSRRRRRPSLSSRWGPYATRCSMTHVTYHRTRSDTPRIDQPTP